MPAIKKTCEVCKRVFYTDYKFSKYCSRKCQMYAANRRRYENGRIKIEMAKIAKSDNTMVAEAKAKNTTYGKIQSEHYQESVKIDFPDWVKRSNSKKKRLEEFKQLVRDYEESINE